MYSCKVKLYSFTTKPHVHFISKSNSKQFENVIAIEILPGHYKMVFRFNPLPSGYNKCEPMKMEFAMQELIYLNTNIQRMYHKYGNTFPQTHPAINILNHFIGNSDLYNKDLRSITYRFPMKLPFLINEDDKTTFEPVITVTEITFQIDSKDNKKLRLDAFTSSDFFYEEHKQS